MAFAAQDYYLVKVWRIMDHGLFADRPSADSPDRLWWASDEKVLYRDTGSAWHRISSFDGHAYGNTFANRPAAGIDSRFFFATDQLVLYRDNGVTWDTVGSALIHASRHENGGPDEIDVTDLSGELADRQPVKLHAVQHVTGGDDVIANAIAAGNSGLMTGADKTKIDGLGAGSNVAADANIGDHKLVRGDGGAKKIQECSTISVSDTGEVVNTGQSCFSVLLGTSANNIATDNWIHINFLTEVFDVGNNFASGVFTAPVTGKYQLNTIIHLDNVDTGAVIYLIKLNTSNRYFYYRLDPNFSADSDALSITISVITDMEINDEADVWIYQEAGTQQTDVHSISVFTGALIC